MYWTVATVVEGALEDERDLADWDDVQARLNDVAVSAAQDGAHTLIYVLQHNHEMLDSEEGCYCNQYLSDHSPYQVFNERSKNSSPDPT